jgi:hypothetical protein
MRIAPKGKRARVTLPLQSALEDLTTGDVIKVAWLANLFRKKLQEQGVKIGEREFGAITEQVRKRFRNEDGLSWESPWELDIAHEGEVKVEFGPQDFEGIAELITDSLTSAVQETVTATAPIMMAGVLAEIDSEFESRLRKTEEFRTNLITRWRKPLKLLSAQIAIAAQYGQDLNTWLRDNPPDGKSSVVEAITRLQARATQIAWEIEVLLQNGFADGALSRWRTLHEVSIVALFIEQEGEDTARKYLDHLEVDSRDMARFMQKAAAKSGHAELTPDEVLQLEAKVSELRALHGNEFDGYHGWASKAIEARLKSLGVYDPKKKVNPNFFDIEEAVDMDRLRPYYKLASGAVHAGPKGAFFKLGLPPQYPNAILAGPSNAGLSEAGRLTAWSLGMTCVALMMVEPILDGLAWANVIVELGSQAGNAFVAAEKYLRDDEGIVDEKRTRLVGRSGVRLRVPEKPSGRLRRRMGLR